MKRWPLVFLIPALALGGFLALMRFVYSIAFNPKKAWVIALGFDDLDNAAFNGRLGQSISSRAAHAQVAGKQWGCDVCAMLDDIDPGHCERALTAKNQNLQESRETE